MNPHLLAEPPSASSPGTPAQRPGAARHRPTTRARLAVAASSRFAATALVRLVAALALLGAASLAPLAGIAQAQPVHLEDLATFPRTTLEIVSGGQRHVFSVWVADTGERQAQGLMFVRDLPADQGMLFPQREPRPVGFWMKNTFVPLDMVFIDRHWRIARIAKMTKPHSLDVVPSDGPVIAVLELRGGEADRRGLRQGNTVKVAKSR